jgi:DNA-3-methyladenine glycosylase II
MPYSLADSWLGRAGGTRRRAEGVVRLAFRVGGDPASAKVWQRGDGALGVEIDAPEPEAALARLRFLLAVDVDHAPFLRIARRDPVLREVAWRWPGIRPMRLATPAHALVKAVCGQLVASPVAAALERAVLARCAPRHADLRLPPTREEVAALAPSSAVGAGLAARRAATMVRTARTLDLDRLATEPTERVVRRIGRERGLGPWSAGVICLHGLGRYEQGLVGDLGLIRLWAAQRGEWPAPEETAELLEPYGEWAGLASMYMLRHPLAGRHGPAAPRSRRTPLAAAWAKA